MSSPEHMGQAASCRQVDAGKELERHKIAPRDRDADGTLCSYTETPRCPAKMTTRAK